MNSNPEPANSGGLDDKFPTSEEYAKWLKADPANAEHCTRIIERVAKGEYGELTPELRVAAEKAVAKFQEARSIGIVSDKFKALMAVMQAPAGSMLAEERLAQCNALMDELTDALLETSEPHRTGFLKQVLPLREQIRALKVDD
jgi:hypothetical protein